MLRIADNSPPGAARITADNALMAWADALATAEHLTFETEALLGCLNRDDGGARLYLTAASPMMSVDVTLHNQSSRLAYKPLEPRVEHPVLDWRLTVDEHPTYARPRLARVEFTLDIEGPIEDHTSVRAAQIDRVVLSLPIRPAATDELDLETLAGLLTPFSPSGAE